jgi:hypothetical protein
MKNKLERITTKRPWPNLRSYSGICLEEVSETSQDCQLNSPDFNTKVPAVMLHHCNFPMLELVFSLSMLVFWVATACGPVDGY